MKIRESLNGTLGGRHFFFIDLFYPRTMPAYECKMSIQIYCWTLFELAERLNMEKSKSSALKDCDVWNCLNCLRHEAAIETDTQNNKKKSLSTMKPFKPETLSFKSHNLVCEDLLIFFMILNS